MSKVILDTNIWLTLGRRLKYDKPKPAYLSDYTVKGTYFNIFELSFSPNFFVDQPEDKKENVGINQMIFAVKALGGHVSYGDFILIHPIEYLLGEGKSKLHIEYNKQLEKVYEVTLDRGGKYSNLTKFPGASNDERLVKEEEQREFKNKAVNDILVFLQKNIDDLRQKHKSEIRNFSLGELFDTFKDQIKNYLIVLVHFFCEELDIDKIKSDKIDWENNEFVLSMWTYSFIIKLKKEKGYTENYEHNDIYDLFHMIYVQKGDYFYTNEKFWLKIMDNDPSLKKYNFKNIIDIST